MRSGRNNYCHSRVGGNLREVEFMYFFIGVVADIIGMAIAYSFHLDLKYGLYGNGSIFIISFLSLVSFLIGYITGSFKKMSWGLAGIYAAQVLASLIYLETIPKIIGLLSFAAHRIIGLLSFVDVIAVFIPIGIFPIIAGIAGYSLKMKVKPNTVESIKEENIYFPADKKYLFIGVDIAVGNFLIGILLGGSLGGVYLNAIFRLIIICSVFFWIGGKTSDFNKVIQTVIGMLIMSVGLFIFNFGSVFLKGYFPITDVLTSLLITLMTAVVFPLIAGKLGVVFGIKQSLKNTLPKQEE